MSVWLPPSGFLRTCDLKKFRELTHDPMERKRLSDGTGSAAAFLTPFTLGTTMTVYVNNVAATVSSVAKATGIGERDIVTLSANPPLGAVVEAVCEDAVNVDAYETASITGQTKIGGLARAQLFLPPLNDAIDVIEPLLGWVATLTAFNLATSARRPMLLWGPDGTPQGPYAGIGLAYYQLVNEPGDLWLLAKGRYSLVGVLPVMASADRPGAYFANEPVFTAENYRGL